MPTLIFESQQTRMSLDDKLLINFQFCGNFRDLHLKNWFMDNFSPLRFLISLMLPLTTQDIDWSWRCPLALVIPLRRRNCRTVDANMRQINCKIHNLPRPSSCKVQETDEGGVAVGLHEMKRRDILVVPKVKGDWPEWDKDCLKPVFERLLQNKVNPLRFNVFVEGNVYRMLFY